MDHYIRCLCEMNRGECLMSLYFSVKDDSLRIITPSLPAYGLTMIQHQLNGGPEMVGYPGKSSIWIGFSMEKTNDFGVHRYTVRYTHWWKPPNDIVYFERAKLADIGWTRPPSECRSSHWKQGCWHCQIGGWKLSWLMTKFFVNCCKIGMFSLCPENWVALNPLAKNIHFPSIWYSKKWISTSFSVPGSIPNARFRRLNDITPIPKEVLLPDFMGNSRWKSVFLGNSRWKPVFLGNSRWESVFLGKSRWKPVFLGDKNNVFVDQVIDSTNHRCFLVICPMNITFWITLKFRMFNA